MKIAMSLLIVILAVACGAAEDGKVYVQTDPAGATITLVIEAAGQKDTYKEFEKKTPALVQVPQGEHRLLLTLDGYKSSMLNVDVAGVAINKPDVVKLAPATVALDVVFSQDGWSVLVDKKPVKDSSSKPAIAPCTIPVQKGKHEIVLAKEGFVDMTTQVEVAADMALDIDKIGLKPIKGKGKTDDSKQNVLPVSFSGKIYMVADDKAIVYVNGERIGECVLDKASTYTSKEISLKDGDIVTIDLMNPTGGGYAFAMTFVSSDNKYLMSPREASYKDISSEKGQLSAARLQAAKKVSAPNLDNRVALEWKTIPSVKDMSPDWVWSESSKAGKIGFVVKSSMFEPLK